jgi:hypothetical protein
MPASTASKRPRKAVARKNSPRQLNRHASQKTTLRAASKPARRSASSKASKASGPSKQQKWSADVTRNSNALDLESNVFQKKRPADIARSLKRSAEQSTRRKTTPYQSAMSMLTFYVNRAGRNLPESRLRVLEQAKDELRKAFGR